MASEDTIVKGSVGLAAAFEVSRRTAQRWMKDPTFPWLSGGRFDVGQVRGWLADKDGQVASAPAPRLGDANQPKLVPQSGKDYQEARVKKLTADIKELEYCRMKGELIEVAELEALLVPRAMAYRQGLIAFEQILAPRLAAALGLPPESLRVMKAVIHEVAGEVLANVLRALTLPAGQALKWEGAPADPDEQL